MSSGTDATTHASRNPTKDVQEARQRKKGNPLTPAQKATKAIQAQERLITAQDFALDLDKFFAYRGKTALELAAKYNRSPDYIKSLLMNASQFKATRTVSLRNAVMHDISEKSKAEGISLGFPELHRRADEVFATNPPDDEEAEQLLDMLRASRDLKRVGARSSNIAASVDARSSIADIQDEFMSLYERTGTRGFAFFTRGHLNDAVMPTFVQSGDAIAFCVEVLKKPAVDILLLFEQWSCARGQAQVQRDTRASLCSELSQLIESKLHAITLNDTVSVSYVNMDVDIREAWKVEIVGWPVHLPVVCPSKIKQIENLRLLRDAWLNGDIHWVVMTPAQIKELAVDLAKRRAANNGVIKKRKARNDIGGTHKSSAKAKSSGKGKSSKKGKSKRRHHESDENDDPMGDDDEPSASEDEDEEGEGEQQHPTRSVRPVTRSAAATPSTAAPTTSSSTTTTTTDVAAPGTAASPPVAAFASASASVTASASASPSVTTDSPVAPNTAAFAGIVSAGSFIAYMPPGVLADGANTASRKRKAVEDASGGEPVKKVRKPRKDKGTKRGPRDTTATTQDDAGPSHPRLKPVPRRAPGSGYKAPAAAVTRGRDDETTRRILAQNKAQRSDESTARAAAALASQLPPGYTQPPTS
ncbi:hypothetical protein C8R44DRAFT_880789 [Mycena epipterygia]|nr:hypothetical protein C8R44DRAFT_880789 [Mycena epipterygia]